MGVHLNRRQVLRVQVPWLNGHHPLSRRWQCTTLLRPCAPCASSAPVRLADAKTRLVQQHDAPHFPYSVCSPLLSLADPDTCSLLCDAGR